MNFLPHSSLRCLQHLYHSCHFNSKNVYQVYITIIISLAAFLHESQFKKFFYYMQSFMKTAKDLHKMCFISVPYYLYYSVCLFVLQTPWLWNTRECWYNYPYQVLCFFFYYLVCFTCLSQWNVRTLQIMVVFTLIDCVVFMERLVLNKRGMYQSLDLNNE